MVGLFVAIQSLRSQIFVISESGHASSQTSPSSTVYRKRPSPNFDCKYTILSVTMEVLFMFVLKKVQLLQLYLFNNCSWVNIVVKAKTFLFFKELAGEAKPFFLQDIMYVTEEYLVRIWACQHDLKYTDSFDWGMTFWTISLANSKQNNWRLLKINLAHMLFIQDIDWSPQLCVTSLVRVTHGGEVKWQCEPPSSPTQIC